MFSDGLEYLSTKKTNFNPIQAESQLPLWMKGFGNESPSQLGLFLQSYYDWLSNYYGDENINLFDIQNLMDVEETPEFILPHFINSYAPDIIGVYDIPDDLRPTADNIRQTIKNIRTEVYQRKSTEDAFKSLMASLFSINPETIQLSYPKRKLLRLNGGILDWMTDSTYYGTTGEYSDERYTMVGSYLNQGVMPDNKMWQENSYILTSEIPDSNPYYEAVIKQTLHPAGLLGLYEKIEQYSEGDYFPQPEPVFERPIIANYYPYSLQSTTSLPRCSGCTGELVYASWKYPTFVYPSWDVEISKGPSANFGSIILRDFFTLSPADEETWPNDLIGTTCQIACGQTGDVEFAFYVDNELDRVPPAIVQQTIEDFLSQRTEQEEE